MSRLWEVAELNELNKIEKALGLLEQTLVNGWIMQRFYFVVHVPSSYISNKSSKIIIFIFQVFRESEDDASHQLVNHLVSTLNATYQLHPVVEWLRGIGYSESGRLFYIQGH